MPTRGKFYYSKPLDRSTPLFEWANWHNNEPPKDGKSFAARPVGYNIVVSAQWSDQAQDFIMFREGKATPIKIHQWLTFQEWGKIQTCVWKGCAK